MTEPNGSCAEARRLLDAYLVALTHHDAATAGNRRKEVTSQECEVKHCLESRNG